MELKEVTQDLFALPETYLLAHCISSDARMGAGIAVAFRTKFDLSTLQAEAKQEPLEIGSCYRVGRVLNLVTKKKYSGKPTYQSLREALVSMRSVCEEEAATNQSAGQGGGVKIGMPRIGCGLDRLEWAKVKDMLGDVFGGWEGEITICFLQ